MFNFEYVDANILEKTKLDTIFEYIPLVSVAMTTYNGEKYLKEQIDSILNQSYKNIELVICDDCSKDGTWSILQEYATIDNRIKIVQNSSNLGFVRNFEQAISLCTGDFIALSDQDDIWEKWKIEESVKTIGNHDLLCSNSLLVDSNNNSLGHTLKDTLEFYSIPDNQEILFKHLCFENFVQGSTILAQAAFLQPIAKTSENSLKIGYHDYWYAFKATEGNGIIYLDKCTIRYRQHEKQVTTNPVKSTFTEQMLSSLKEDEVSNHLNWCNNHVQFQDILLSMPLSAERRQFVEETKKYFECMKKKNWYTFCYFVKYHDVIYLDNHIFRKILRIAKRFLGLIRHKIGG